MTEINSVKKLLGSYTAEIDEALRVSIPVQDAISLYRHLEYFLGFRDEDLNEIDGYGGKRFRSAVCLMLGDWYGNKAAALPAATSIELFHNFTLVHDDIVDKDELRRGRPTVWKLFGTDYAINDGDAQLILSLQYMVNSEDLTDTQKTRLQSFLLKQYLRVIEGQHMDFVLADAKLGDEFVTKENYLKMIGRKTADLISAATKGAGLVAGVSEEEQKILFDLGQTIGVGYQMCDDAASIWDTSKETGKQAHGDIFGQKKTLPILYAYEVLEKEDKNRLAEIFNTSTTPTQKEVDEVLSLLLKAKADTYIIDEISLCRQQTFDLIARLSLNDDQKEILSSIVGQLLSEGAIQK